MSDKPLIYAVDDEEAIRELYSCALESFGFDVRCFCMAKEFFDALEKEVPALAILDIMLDDTDGFGILSQMREDKRYCGVPVIMVSAKDGELSKVKGLNAGADDYVTKPFGVMELVARINASIRKSQPKAAKTVYKDIEVDDAAHVITAGECKLSLTLKEYGLLKLLVANAQNTLTRDVIMNKVWGEDYFGETRTLDAHVNSLRRTLGSAGSAAEIETVRGVGFMLV